MFGNPVAQDVEHSVGGGPADEELLVVGFLRVGKSWTRNSRRFLLDEDEKDSPELCHDSTKTRWEICFSGEGSCPTPSVSLTLRAAVSSCGGGDGEGRRGGHGTAGAIGRLTYEDTTRENKSPYHGKLDFLVLKYEFNPANREHSQKFGQCSLKGTNKHSFSNVNRMFDQMFSKLQHKNSLYTVHPSLNGVLLKRFSWKFVKCFFFLNVTFRNVQGTFKSNVCKIIKCNVPLTKKKKHVKTFKKTVHFECSENIVFIT